MMKKYSFLLFALILSLHSYAQGDSSNDDAFVIRKIYDEALTNSKAYKWLDYLSNAIGGRLSGSPQAAAAVEYTRQLMVNMGLDSVWLQPCEVPHWVRGEAEEVRIVNSSIIGTKALHALALGNSPATPAGGINAEVVEVTTLDEVEQLGRAGVEGKIVFYNRPMDPKQFRTFNAYGGAVDQRAYGPAKAAKFGAVGTLVRSMTTKHDFVPHTGVTVFPDSITAIPAIAISTNDANELSQLLKKESVRVYMKANCQQLSNKESYNVVGEIRGSTHPDEIILVGGHLDSWDVGGGAHDDGAGCVHALDVLRLLKQINYQPKRTIRCVLFMNEENGLVGGRAYAEASNLQKEYHLAAIESDAGGFSPRGFSCDGDVSTFTKHFRQLNSWLPLLEPYGLMLTKGGSGADISPLKSQKGLLVGLRPDSQRYFDYHHTAADTFDAVNQRELELGAAAITTLVYLIDKHGL